LDKLAAENGVKRLKNKYNSAIQDLLIEHKRKKDSGELKLADKLN